MDGHPGLRRNRRNDPKREPPPSTPPPLKTAVETRRQKRLAKFGPPLGPTSVSSPTTITETFTESPNDPT